MSRSGKPGRRQRRKARARRRDEVIHLQSYQGLGERIRKFKARANLYLVKADNLARRRDEKYYPDGTPRDDAKQKAA